MQTTPGTSLTDDTPTPAQPAGSSKIRLWAAVAALVYVLDQSTKWWAAHSLADLAPQQLVGDWLQFRLTYNPGAAFSMGTGYTVVLTALALVVIGVCIRMSRRLGSTGWAVALGLLLGGALGNVTDRIVREPAPFRGHVIDFIQLPHWPVFNIADTAITTAAVLFVLLSLRGVHLDGTVDGRVGRSPDDGSSDGRRERA